MDDSNVDMRTAARKAVQGTRRPPGEPSRVRAAFQGGAECGDESIPGPIDLEIEATGADGEVAAWFHDVWWIDILQRWGDGLVTVQILPTPAALLHPRTLHYLEMVARVAPRWRLVGHAYLSDVSTDDEVALLARSPYHEVRFFDKPRPPATRSDRCLGTLSIGDLFGRVRSEQVRIKATKPILVRLPALEEDPLETPRTKTDTGAIPL